MLGAELQHAVTDPIDVSPAVLVLDFAGRSSTAEMRSRLQRSEPATPVFVAVPAWFGMADRRQVATYLDPDGSWKLTLVSSTLAGVHGHHLGNPGPDSAHSVLCLDLRQGWSAGLVHVAAGRLTEVAVWGAAPGESVDSLETDDGCRSMVEHLAAELSLATNVPPVSAVLVMSGGGDSATRVRRAIEHGEHALAGSTVLFLKRGRQVVAKGAASMFHPEDAPSSVGALARSLTVLAEDDPERTAMTVVAAEHALFPSSARLTFDLGPSDGSPLHFDVFEQRRMMTSETVNSFVLRAHLVRERGYDRSMVVTFELGADGLFTIGPAQAWRLEWQPGSLDLDTSG